MTLGQPVAERHQISAALDAHHFHLQAQRMRQMVVQRKGEIALARAIVTDAQWRLPCPSHAVGQRIVLPGLGHDLDELVDLPPLAGHGWHQCAGPAHNAQVHQIGPADVHRIASLPVVISQVAPAILIRQGVMGAREGTARGTGCHLPASSPAQLRERPHARLPGSRTAGRCLHALFRVRVRVRVRQIIRCRPTILQGRGLGHPLHPEQRPSPLAEAQLGRQLARFQKRRAHVAQQRIDPHQRLVHRQVVGLVARVVLPGKGQLHAIAHPYRLDAQPLKHRALVREARRKNRPNRPRQHQPLQRARREGFPKQRQEALAWIGRHFQISSSIWPFSSG